MVYLEMKRLMCESFTPEMKRVKSDSFPQEMKRVKSDSFPQEKNHSPPIPLIRTPKLHASEFKKILDEIDVAEETEMVRVPAKGRPVLGARCWLVNVRYV